MTACHFKRLHLSLNPGEMTISQEEREYIHVYINRLRKKIETPAQRRFIYNEPKVGYRFQADGPLDS